MTYAADQQPSGLDAASAVADADLFVGAQGGDAVAFTGAQLKAFVLGSADALVYKGSSDCSANPNYPAADAGYMYKVSVAGKIGGSTGMAVAVGDLFICLVDSTASGNQATVGSNWDVIHVDKAAASTTQPAEQIAGYLGTVTDKTITIVVKAAHPGVITEATTQTEAGTATVTFKIGSTALGGTANSASTSVQSQSHASANAFSAGDQLKMTISSSSGCSGLSFALKYTRQLA